MSVLVTGATGFVGGAYVRHLLAAGERVVVLHRDSAAAEQALEGLSDLGAEIRIWGSLDGVATEVADAGADAVVHLATRYLRDHAPSDVSPLVRANVELGAQVLEGAAAAGSRVVTASSFFQFRHGEPVSRTLYSATKQALDDIADFYAERRGLEVARLVLFETYGPADSRDKLVPAILAALRAGREQRVGSPDQPLHLVHADDVVAAIDAARRGASGTFAVRHTDPTTIGELVAAVDDLSGGAARITPDPGARVDRSALEAGDWPGPPGWRPAVSLRDGLRPLVEAAAEALP